jgi:hypothetical protein
MATLRWILYDESGKEIADQQQALPEELTTMAQIEAAVETIRQTALPQVSKALLEEGQQTFKKKPL